MFILLKLFFIVCIFFLTPRVYGFFEIAEVFPNTLDDKNLEYVTLKNISESEKSLSGYTLADKSKSYTFIEDLLVQPWERYIAYRTQTKIILNNTNEQLTLLNPEWELIDEVEYETSIKGEFLTFEDLMDDSQDVSIISEESYISWEIFISDEVDVWENISEEKIDMVWSTSEEEREVLLAPDVIFSLQRPSYITQSWSTNIYVCDSEKDECKVNFDLRESFTEEFPKRDYKCYNDFWIWENTGQERRCNPNTVVFPKWIFEVSFKIAHEDDVSIFSQKNITVHNIPLPATISSQSIWTSNSIHEVSVNDEIEDKKIAKIYIRKPRIIVQSGLVGAGRYFSCEKIECSINLDYKKQHKDEVCRWDFADAALGSPTTYRRCNPWYVTLPEWIHELSLRVYEKDNEVNQRTLKFYIYNRKDKLQPASPTKEKEFRDEGDENLEENRKEEIGIVSLSMNVQWKISKEKTLEWNTLICRDVEKCYVNFQWVIEWWDGVREYTWKLNGEVFSEKLNPAGIWVKWEWDHEIIFQVWEIQQVFKVQIIEKDIDLLSSKWEESQSWQSENDNINKIDFTQNFLPLKYDGLRISWKAPEWSTIEVSYGSWNLLKWSVDSKGKYRIVSKDFTPWEYTFQTKIILESWEEVFIQDSWITEIFSEDRAFWFQTKKKSSRRTTGSKTTTWKTPTLIVKSPSVLSKTEIQDISLGMKIFLVIVVCFAGMFGALHLALQHIQVYTPGVLWIYTLRYWVKQKVCLIL